LQLLELRAGAPRGGFIFNPTLTDTNHAGLLCAVKSFELCASY
jgi:hypothetical protein